MKTFARFVVLFASCAAMADIGWYQGNSRVGSVIDISCRNDGGLACTRDGGSKLGALSCLSATATEPGCVVPSAQTWAGTKTLSSGGVRIVGVAHASLTACASGTKGLQQTCTTHNALVWCDGTTNLELVGSGSGEEVLSSVYVNGVPYGYYTAGILSAGGAWTVINAIKALWIAGTGSGSLSWVITDGSNTCTCAVDCDAPSSRTTCSGTCSFAASTGLFLGSVSSTCTLDPAVYGNLEVMGVTQ